MTFIIFYRNFKPIQSSILSLFPPLKAKPISNFTFLHHSIYFIKNKHSEYLQNQCIRDYYWRIVTFLMSVMKHITLSLVPVVLLVYTEISCPLPPEKYVTDLGFFINSLPTESYEGIHLTQVY